jgi:hypothetical protein
VTSARDTRVFSAGGYRFTWVEVIDAARIRGDWTALQRHVAGLLARERDLSAYGALPTSAETRSAADDFRYQRKLLSADELEEWLARRDISVEQWMAEMRRSLLEPTNANAEESPEGFERISWVHAVCSGKLAQFARTLAEEVAVHLTEQPSTAPGKDQSALPRGREQFCAAQLREPALATEIRNNKIGWTRFDLQLLIHPDEMVVREAALCVRLDGRELADVAADAGAQLQDVSLLLDDAEPALRTRLLAADPGELIGPLATGADHRLLRVLRRIPPSLDDPAVRRRAEETVIDRALAAAVNRHVNWHEHL